MSVVPFILDDDLATVGVNSDDFNPNGTKILMLNLDEKQLTNINDANTSYDLTIGDEYRDYRAGRGTHLNEGDTITLEPGGAVVIQTQEWVRFPKTRFGQILPKVRLLEDGISNTTSKIDPGYIGYLTITLFNLGKTTKTLKKGDKFCTLVVHSVEPGVRPYNKPGKTIPNDAKAQSKWKNMKYWMERNTGFITILGVGATLVLTIVTVIATIINLNS